MPLVTEDGQEFHLGGLNFDSFSNAGDLLQKGEVVAKTENDSIQKSHISNAFSGYGAEGNNLKFSKTGKQMKEALVNKKTSIMSDIAGKKAKVDQIATSIKELGCGEPTEKAVRYGDDEAVTPEVKQALDNLKIFGWQKRDEYWDMKRAIKNKYKEGLEIGEVDKQELQAIEDKEKLLSEHDDCVHKIISCYVDIETCNVMERNLQDNKIYNLNIKQLKSLGL